MKQILEGAWYVVKDETDKLQDPADRALKYYISQEVILVASRKTIFTVAGKAMYRTPSIKAECFEKHTHSQCSALGARPLEVEIKTVAMFSPVHMWLGCFRIRPFKTPIIIYSLNFWPEHQKSRTLCSQLREGSRFLPRSECCRVSQCGDKFSFHSDVCYSPL